MTARSRTRCPWPPALRGTFRLQVSLRWVIVIAAIVAGAAGLAVGAQREIPIYASQFAYDPPRVHVTLGDHVTLRITSTDITHGIAVDGYGITAVVTPYHETLVSFVADRPGKIRYRCTVVCGNLHPFMVGEIIVEPNRPLWTSFALAVLAAAGAIAVLWRR